MTRPTTHSPEFLAAFNVPGMTMDQPEQYTARDLVLGLAALLSCPEMISGGHFTKATAPVPTWTAAPGNAEGLAALRAIMEALGYRTETRTATDGDGSFFIFDSVTEHVLVIVESDGWRHTAKQLLWTDPTALPRLLHLALGLCPKECKS